MRAYFIRILLQHLAFGFTIPIGTLFMLSRGLSLTEIAFTNALVLGVSFISEIPTGYISDRFGRKNSIALSSLIIAISMGLFAASYELTSFLLAAIIQGIGFSALSGADDAFVYDTLKEKHQESEYKKTYGNISMIDEFATLLGMLSSSAILYLGSMTAAFVIASLLLCVTALYSLVVLREPTAHDEKQKNISESVEKHPTHIVQIIWNFLRNNNEFFVAMIAFSFLSETGRFLWQPKMEEAGIAAAWFGIYFAIIKLCAILGGYVVTKQRHSTRVYHIFIISLLGTLCFLLASLSSVVFVIGGIALYSFVESLYRAYRSDYVNERVSTKLRATALSANAMCTSFAGMLFSIILGAVADHISLTYAFISIAAIQLIGGISILSNRRFHI